eukprot:14439409-Heterocapsa_arctica.AAC.1
MEARKVERAPRLLQGGGIREPEAVARTPPGSEGIPEETIGERATKSTTRADTGQKERAEARKAKNVARAREATGTRVPV